MATSSGFAAARRKLTGVARGGALAIARHSLRSGVCGAAGMTSQPRKAATSMKDRSMARPVAAMAAGDTVSPKSAAVMMTIAHGPVPDLLHRRGAMPYHGMSTLE